MVNLKKISFCLSCISNSYFVFGSENLPVKLLIKVLTMEGVSGWIFKNESDCFNFFKLGGRIANYRTCPTQEVLIDMNSTTASSLVMKKEECDMMAGSTWDSCCPCCPPVWDGFLCWPPSKVNTNIMIIILYFILLRLILLWNNLVQLIFSN